jgi:hypothetical protein
MMDSFAEQIAAGLSPSSVPAEPPAGLVEDILRDVRRGRRLRQAGTALAVVLLLAAAGLAAARFGPGRRDAVPADPLAALTGAARAERYPMPAGTTVLALTPSGTALAVSGGAQKTLWLLRPDGNWTVLDHGHSRVADWATDGTLVAWTWTAKDERGWKCLDRPGAAPVTLALDPTGYQRMFADQGHLAYGYGEAHVLTGCGDDRVVTPTDPSGIVAGLRWPVVYLSTAHGISAEDLLNGATTQVADGLPADVAGTAITVAAPQGTLWSDDREVMTRMSERWTFQGQRAGAGRPTTLAVVPWSNGVRRVSAGRTWLATFVTHRPHESRMHLAYDEDPAISVVYEPSTGRHAKVDGAVFVAGDLLLHHEADGGYRLYHLAG